MFFVCMVMQLKCNKHEQKKNALCLLTLTNELYYCVASRISVISFNYYGVEDTSCMFSQRSLPTFSLLIRFFAAYAMQQIFFLKTGLNCRQVIQAHKLYIEAE